MIKIKDNSKYNLIILTLILIILVIVYNFYILNNNKIYKFGELEIKKTDFDILTNSINDSLFQLCDIESNKCIIMEKINNNGNK